MKNENKIHLKDSDTLAVHVGGRIIHIDNTAGQMVIKMWSDTDQETFGNTHRFPELVNFENNTQTPMTRNINRPKMFQAKASA